jgi:hypothetical protein
MWRFKPVSSDLGHGPLVGSYKYGTEIIGFYKMRRLAEWLSASQGLYSLEAIH